jgi:predicted nucleotidyltransferase
MKFFHNNNKYELIVLNLAGSKLYGNSTPSSDTDYRGVFIASKDSKLGILGTVEQLEGVDVWKSLVAAGLDLIPTDDIVIYELNRFIALAIDNNPNIMDTLCFDYNNPEFTVYVNEKGKELIDNKHLLISSKLKFTFSGYAISQLQRIKSHGKWLTQFPDINDVLAEIKEAFNNSFIDFNWICDNFGGQVAEKVTGETPQKNTKFENTLTWIQFKNCANESRKVLDLKELDFDMYRVPRLIDYCHPKDLKGKQLDLNDLRETLQYTASFRTMSPSMLVIYTAGRGIFSKEGNLKANDPETIGEFVCLLSIDQNKYKSDKDYINKLWEWKCNRNEKRSELEEKFGVDLKHLSHLWRLMTKAKEILLTCTYDPQLKGEELKTLKGIRDGSLYGRDSYDFALKFAEENDKLLNELYKTTKLQKKPDVKKVNELVLRLQKD